MDIKLLKGHIFIRAILLLSPLFVGFSHSQNDDLTLKKISELPVSSKVITTITHEINGKYFIYSGGNNLLIDIFELEKNGNLKFLENVTMTGNSQGHARGLVTSTIGSSDYLFVGNKFGHALEVYKIQDNGTLERVFVVNDTENTYFNTNITLQVVHMQNSSYIFIGGFDPGLTCFKILDNGHLLHIQSIPDNDSIFTNAIIGMTVRKIKDRTFLVLGGIRDEGISAFEVFENGLFKNTSNIADDSTLFLDGTYPLTSVTLSGMDYVLVGHVNDFHYNGSTANYHGDALSVFSLDSNGVLTPHNIFEDNEGTLLRASTRVEAFKFNEKNALIIVATRNDNGIQLMHMDEFGNLKAVGHTNFGDWIYNGMTIRQIDDRYFVIAGTYQKNTLTVYEIGVPDSLIYLSIKSIKRNFNVIKGKFLFGETIYLPLNGKHFKINGRIRKLKPTFIGN